MPSKPPRAYTEVPRVTRARPDLLNIILGPSLTASPPLSSTALQSIISVELRCMPAALCPPATSAHMSLVGTKVQACRALSHMSSVSHACHAASLGSCSAHHNTSTCATATSATPSIPPRSIHTGVLMICREPSASSWSDESVCLECMPDATRDVTASTIAAMLCCMYACMYLCVCVCVHVHVGRQSI